MPDMRRTLLALLALPFLAGASLAQNAPRAVVELFTSQGCSSCPPADGLVAELARNPEILVLTLPVDYWDYLGWKDTLAQAAFTERQRSYASLRGDQQVYTPQAVVNGATMVVGSDRSALDRTIRDAASGLHVPMRCEERAGHLAVEVGTAAGAPDAALWLLPVSRSRHVTIGRGENRGRSMTYANVVRGMTRLGTWTGAATRFEVPSNARGPKDADSYVVLLQAGRDGAGRIIGAAKGPGL
jgi:hypothetical protein